MKVYGYSVITASSGADGLRIISEGQRVDLVLLDYMMPGMTGEQVAKELKLLYPTVAVVIISGFPEVPQNLLTMVDGYVQKGQDPDVVIGTIARALAPRRLQG